jgi:23S rRNA pseudouridine1911/1915/1917 synthase
MPLLHFDYKGDGDEAAPRLDAFLAREMENPTRSDVQSWIKDGRAKVNGTAVARPARRLHDGDVIELDRPPPESGLPTAAHIEFKIAFSDEHIAVVDKPAGLTVHPGAGHQADTLVNGLIFRWPEIAGVGDPLRPGIVHRLDRDTSGLLAIALSEQAYGNLSEAIRARKVTRRYTTLVHGIVQPDHGIVDAPMSRDPRRPTRQRTRHTGRPARTHYEVTAQYPGTALLAVTLETGRTHQIRVHMAAIDFPVVGDPVYGRPGFGLKRQFLHASGLEFAHPVTGEPLTFESDLPEDLAATLSLARDA